MTSKKTNFTNACPDGKERNPSSGRCILKCAPTFERLKTKCLKKCPDTKMRNPATRRCITTNHKNKNKKKRTGPKNSAYIVKNTQSSLTQYYKPVKSGVRTKRIARTPPNPGKQSTLTKYYKPANKADQHALSVSSLSSPAQSLRPRAVIQEYMEELDDLDFFNESEQQSISDKAVQLNMSSTEMRDELEKYAKGYGAFV